jgi:hypothetical protein
MSTSPYPSRCDLRGAAAEQGHNGNGAAPILTDLVQQTSGIGQQSGTIHSEPGRIGAVISAEISIEKFLSAIVQHKESMP